MEAKSPCNHLGSLTRIIEDEEYVCPECVALGDEWVHLRVCQTCGHVGCCDSSPHRHATAHFHATGHPIIEGYDPPEGWGWCYLDRMEVDVGPPTPQAGPIPKFV